MLDEEVCLVSSPCHGHVKSATLRIRSVFVGVVLHVLARYTVLTILPSVVAFLSVCSVGADDLVSRYGLCMLSTLHVNEPTSDQPPTASWLWMSR